MCRSIGASRVGEGDFNMTLGRPLWQILLQDPLNVTSTVQDANYFNPLRGWLVEDEVIGEALDRPESHTSEAWVFQQFGGTHLRHGSEFFDRIFKCSQQPFSGIDVVVCDV